MFIVHILLLLLLLDIVCLCAVNSIQKIASLLSTKDQCTQRGRGRESVYMLSQHRISFRYVRFSIVSPFLFYSLANRLKLCGLSVCLCEKMDFLRLGFNLVSKLRWQYPFFSFGRLKLARTSIVSVIISFSSIYVLLFSCNSKKKH